MEEARPTTYDVLVPVKPPATAKTRLHGQPRAALARAFALDAVTAALRASSVRAVHVVTKDRELIEAAVLAGADVLPDRGGGDLNDALARAAETLAVRTGRVGPVAAMLGDLPCLVTDDLDAALDAARAHDAAFVPDAAGTGTTLVTTRHVLHTRFGPGSRAAHLDAGLTEVALTATTLRRDVDTPADLDEARVLGLGPRTRAVLEVV